MSKDLGPINALGAEAIGQPGQRRFRLFVRSKRGAAFIWMEKEQLNHLSLIIDRFLAQLSQGQVLRTEAQAGGLPATTTSLPIDFPLSPEHDFQVAELRINYEERRSMFQLVAVPLEIIMQPGEEPVARINETDAVSFLFTQQQAQALTNTIAAIVPAGRPVCPLCGTPLDGSPHACVRQNGHREIVPLMEDDAGN
ncbi:MAG TPA: DUF3090 family protein [Ktedonobacteraceae bacterium]|nr:DUF3090 family protein [Ktedonobacteraceae bacterium]